MRSATVSKAAEPVIIFNDQNDYVQNAQAVGLTTKEAELIRQQLGRYPNRVELGMFSAMWSEHCSYKSSRVLLKKLPTKGAKVLQGPGENAGVVDLGEGLALCFKIESHNHPSFIEPYQGATTGVGGILRDIFTMGARPIAFMNSLRFGDPLQPHTQYLLRGVVKGIGGYGNCMGIPTVGGEVFFDPGYQGNILVNAFCAGIMPRDKIFLAKAQGVGNPVIYIGSKTGRDGIHGASMASESFDENSSERRPTVQVGDPFVGKLLMEATLEMMRKGLLVGIQDMGAAGLTCAITEMSDKGQCGMEVELTKVPIREQRMQPFEILLSESQERMLLVCTPENKAAILEVAQHWGIDAAEIGKIIAEPRVRIYYEGNQVVDLPPTILVNEAPLYKREIREPHDNSAVKLKTSSYAGNQNANELCLRLLGSPNIASRAWVYQQYDHSVGTDVTMMPGHDAAIMRLKGRAFGVAMKCAGNSFYTAADPRQGAMLAVFEAARNLACVGATPLAITNCLNFGNPERPEIMWQLDQAIEGMSAACCLLEIPVISGNVSLYNQNGDQDIPPTPVIGMCGKIDAIEKAVPSYFQQAGDQVAILGAVEPSQELTGEVAKHVLAKEFAANRPSRRWPAAPSLDSKLELALHRTLRLCSQQGLLHSAHDCGEGGLAIALAECCFTKPNLGASLTLKETWNNLDLFTEEASRVVISYAPADLEKIQKIAKSQGCPMAMLGEVGGEQLRIAGYIDLTVAQCREAWEGLFRQS